MTKKVLIVLKHEFMQKVKAKSYQILTLIGPILLALIFAIPILFGTLTSHDTRTIAVIDETHQLFAPMSSAHDNAGRSGVELSEVHTGANEAATIDSLKKLVLAKSLNGYFIIPAAALANDTSTQRDTTRIATLHLSNANDMSLQEKIKGSYSTALTTLKLRTLGYDPTLFQRIQKSASIETFKVDTKSDAKANAGSFVLAYVSGFFLYMAMLLYGMAIMRSVIEEKSSRVMEIVVSSIDPYDLLVGKVLGVGLAGLLQMSVWAIIMGLAATVGVSQISSMTGGGLDMHVSPFVFVYFILYFGFGYLLYATLYAAVGATAEQESDVQQISMPITFLIVIPFLTLTTVIQSPSSPLSIVLSLIPFFSPILMMGRILSETPPLWEILLSFVLMALTFMGVLWLAARIYRVGILMYGKRFSLSEVVKWLKYS